MLIAICLLLLAVLGIFSVVLGGTFTGSITEAFIDSTAVVNGTASSFVVEGQQWIFSIDPLAGAIGWFTIIVSISSAVGIKVLGSGLSDQSVRVLITVIVYSSIWTILSIGAWELIHSIEVFGGLIYVSLTIAYAIGVIQQISGNNG